MGVDLLSVLTENRLPAWVVQGPCVCERVWRDCGFTSTRACCGFILTLWLLWFWEMFMYPGFAAVFQKVVPQCGDFNGKVCQWGFFVWRVIIYNACRNVRARAGDDEVFAWRFVGISVYCNNEVFVCVYCYEEKGTCLQSCSQLSLVLWPHIPERTLIACVWQTRSRSSLTLTYFSISLVVVGLRPFEC